MSDEQVALERDAARYRYLRRHMPEWHVDMGKPCTEALAAVLDRRVDKGMAIAIERDARHAERRAKRQEARND